MLLNNKAMSFVELLVSVAIATALGAGLMVGLSVGQNSFLFADTQAQLQQSLRQSLDKIALDLNHATSINITNGGGINGSDVLKFTRVSLCNSGDCQEKDWTYIVYKLNNDNQLIRQILDSSEGLVKENAVAPYVSNFQMEDLEVDGDNSRILSVVIRLEAQKRIKGNEENKYNPLFTGVTSQRVAFRNVFYQE